jgi:hypothetical protein
MMKENCSFPCIRGGHLCLLPLMTDLIGLGHLSDKPRFYRQYAPLLVYHVVPNMANTSWLFVSFGEQERSWGGTRYDKRL